MAFDLFTRVHNALEGETGIDPNQYLPEVPEAVRLFLGRLALLQGVPIHYLIPHEHYLPRTKVTPTDTRVTAPLIEQGSLKIFQLDTEWIESLINGALSVGPDDAGTRETILAKAMAGNYVAEVIFEEKKETIRKQLAGNYQPEAYQQELNRRLKEKGIVVQVNGVPLPTVAQDNWCYTGFLMRSTIISSWVGVEVIAQGGNPTVAGADTSPRTLQVMRFEQIADDTIFCLCEGIITQFEIKQPREALHFDFSAGELDKVNPTAYKNAQGVVDVRKLMPVFKALPVKDAKTFAQNMLAQPLDIFLTVHISYAQPRP